jgi:hypothetical protein
MLNNTMKLIKKLRYLNVNIAKKTITIRKFLNKARSS